MENSQRLLTMCQHIQKGARFNRQRTGQYLFNNLPSVISVEVFDCWQIDPFHLDMDAQEIYDWLDNHLVFDGDEIICLFDGDRILWEKE